MGSASVLNLYPKSRFLLKLCGKTPNDLSKNVPEQVLHDPFVAAAWTGSACGSHSQRLHLCSEESLPSGATTKHRLITKIGQTSLGI